MFQRYFSTFYFKNSILYCLYGDNLKLYYLNDKH